MKERQRILALHGQGSCSDVTRIQLLNLKINNNDDYDISFLDATYVVNQPGFGLTDLNLKEYRSWIIYENFDNSLLDSIEYVLRYIHKNGEFDIGYGFSQGGIIVSIVNELYLNDELKKLLVSKFGESVKKILPNKPLFKIIITSCIASELTLESLVTKKYLLEKNIDDNVTFFNLIGREDKFKSWAEKFSNRSCNTQIIYMPSGHEVNNEADNNVSLTLHELLENKSVIKKSYSNWVKTNPISDRRISQEHQIVEVKLNLADSPKTIKEALSLYPFEYPLLRNARDKDSSNFTSYGDMLEFCSINGDGDLRRIGVKTGDLVAYVAPPGGGAIKRTIIGSVLSLYL
ncbi:hypothetical protein [Gilliamella sp. Pas-s25]|uniref:hypothetical protein n=1 Tax=Gilliamella sp. Pas-s25 TaxID=2687310 RepID=UPI00135DF6EF|nr:hypothetical protein [Gilliamella sp. Pas-s25]MWP63013.1 hypothetical protein [Gilliamella sp. Pas-s25]